jgi:DNA polymerase-1
MSEKLLLIDGSSLIFRGFYGTMRQLDRFIGKNGEYTNAVAMVHKMVVDAIQRIQPTHILVAFDTAEKTFRSSMYPEYKGNRSDAPEELGAQFPLVQEMLPLMGITEYHVVGYEADDIIGTLASQAEQIGWEVSVISGDRDLTQLVSNLITVEITIRGVSEVETYTPEYFYEKNGITPIQVTDVKGLAGDSSDNIPGVTKIGEKTAIKLLKEYDTIENLYTHIDDLKQSKMKEHLIEDEEYAKLSKILATIVTDMPLPFDVTDTYYSGVNDKEGLLAFYDQMNMMKEHRNLSLN